MQSLRLPRPVSPTPCRTPRRLALAALPDFISSTPHLHLLQPHDLATSLELALSSLPPQSLVLLDAAIKPQDNGPLQPLVSALESTLKFFQTGLDRLHVPYSFGWSIVLLTFTVKLLTFPLTKKQIESSMAVQKLKPELDMLKARYGADKARIEKETALLYEQAGVNPLAGCLPTLATIPIFIGLYRSLTAVANEGSLDAQGFYFVPSLAGPTTLAAQRAGTGTAWLFPLVDGHPPIGWHDASCYLVFPILLVAAQIFSATYVSPPTVDPENESQKTTALILKGLPLMLGWFTLNVPAGLGLYYFSNTMFTMAMQVYLKKLGGADVQVNMPKMSAGTAMRSGAAGSVDEGEGGGEGMRGEVETSGGASTRVEGALNGDAMRGVGQASAAMAMSDAAVGSSSSEVVDTFNRRCKRKRRTKYELSMGDDNELVVNAIKVKV